MMPTLTGKTALVTGHSDLHRPRWGSMKHLISVSIKPAAVQW
jgi:hypothetical protein